MIEAQPSILIRHATVRQEMGWLTPARICITSGRITAISTDDSDPPTDLKADTVIDASGMVVIPGLVNAHTHFSQSFMRGLAGGRPLLQWLKELIWPLQGAMSKEELKLASLLCLAENLRGGVTSVVDHHKVTKARAYTSAVKEAVEIIGLRATIARAWVDKGKNAEDSGKIYEELQDLYSESVDSSLVTYASGPLTPWRASSELLQKTHQLSVENGSYTHMHVSETQDEVQMSMDEYGVRPLIWLDKIGVLDQHTQIVHAVWVNELEIELMAQRGCSVVHCPVSNAVLGSGIAPLRKFIDHRISLRLGTDGAASNDSQDCLENMKMAICLARASQMDANNVSCGQVLDMASAGKGLKVGEKADLTLIDLNSLSSAPIHDYDSALVLSAHRDDVDTVIVDGKILLRGKKLLTIDEEILIRECNHAIKSLTRRAGVSL